MTITPAVGQIWDTRCGARVAIAETFLNASRMHEMIKLVVLAPGTSALSIGYTPVIFATGKQSSVQGGSALPLDLAKHVGTFL